MTEKFWYLKDCDLFERLSPEEIARLEEQSRVRKFDRSSLVYLPSDESHSILLLSSGRVKIYYITSDGKQALLTFIDPGELFGELAVFDAGQREDFAETMEKSTVIMIPGHAVQELMERHSEVSMGVTKLMGLRRRRVERRLRGLLFRSIRDRLCFLLLELVEKYGRRTSDGISMEIKLSHQELASGIGSTRETVTVTLGELQDEGLVISKRRQLIITNLDGLAASVDSKPPELLSEKTGNSFETQKSLPGETLPGERGTFSGNV